MTHPTTEQRELLELAAKAAGFGSPGSGEFCWTEAEYPARSGKHGALWNYVGWGSDAELWNPLTDDGDALRLAVRFGMVIAIDSDGMTQVISANADIREPLGSDPYAATRRAIVRAAATRRAIFRAAAAIAKGEKA